MIQKIKYHLLPLAAFLMLAVPLALPATVGAQNIQDSLCEGANFDLDPGGAGNCEEGADAETFEQKLATFINILSIIIGVIAVIMIIFGGFRYMTSGGSQEKVSGAKNTILYALIGLIIVALAQIIVRFVLNQTADL